MTELRAEQDDEQLTAELDAAYALLRTFRSRLDARALSDDDLLRVTAAAAEVGQACGSIDVVVAGEIDERSRPQLGGERLSARKGCRNANELLQRITRVSAATAGKLLRVGAAIRPDRSLTGEPLPARFPAVGDALAVAEVCVDAANAIVGGLTVATLRPDAAVIGAAESELVQAALGSSSECPVPATADDLRLQAAVWRTVIDPDGVEPDEERAMRRRSLTLGQATSAGVPLTGMLMPEAAARLQRLLEAYLSPASAPVSFPRDECDGESAGDATSDSATAGQARETSRALAANDAAVASESRSRVQQQHDVFLSILDSASRGAETPSIGGAPATVMVSVRERDLTSGAGVGWVDGSDVPLSMRTVRQLVCAGGVQKVVFSADNRIVRLGIEQRCFDGRQRRAITLRDGGCVIPGCRVPASWCEIHHVDEHAAGGATHTDNGVLVCWFHHRTIEQSGWEIRMRGGVPHIKAPPWIDREHRRWSPTSTSRTRLAQSFGDTKSNIDHA